MARPLGTTRHDIASASIDKFLFFMLLCTLLSRGHDFVHGDDPELNASNVRDPALGAGPEPMRLGL